MIKYIMRKREWLGEKAGVHLIEGRFVLFAPLEEDASYAVCLLPLREQQLGVVVTHLL